jgi:hypothetical protein
MIFLPVGTPAPHFSLTAEVSKRLISLQSANHLLLLVFHSYQTAPIVGEVIRAVRDAYPNPDQVLVVGIADLRVVPRILRSTAKVYIKNAYNEAVKEVPPGQDPEEHIIILPDWNGSIFEAYEVPSTSKHVALVLINGAKVIAGSYIGIEAAQSALSLINGNAASNSG